MHLAVILALLASLMIFVQRAAQNSGNGVFTLRNIPLAAVVAISAILLELLRRRLGQVTLSFTIASSVAYLIAAFYLPPKGHSHEMAIVLAYLSLGFIFSTGLAAIFLRHVRLRDAVAFAAVIGACATIAGFINTFAPIHVFNGKPEADVAVVLGGGVWGPNKPSPTLKARLDAAATLFKRGEVREIAVTGGAVRFGTIESEIGARYLRKLGIPGDSIMTEDKTENTVEQMIFVKRVLMDRLHMKSVVIVSDAWHLPRALLMCKWMNIRVKAYPSHFRMVLERELYNRFRESAGLQAYILFGA